MRNASRPVQTFTVGMALVTMASSVVWAQSSPNDARRAAEQNVRIAAQQDDGLAQFVTGRNGGIIPVEPSGTRSAARPADFLRQYGVLFGVDDADQQLIQTRADLDDLLHLHTTYEQVHAGVPVFTGVLKVHQNNHGEFVAANGAFHPITEKLDVNPTLTADDAVAQIQSDQAIDRLIVERAELVIVDPGWYGDAQRGAHLAYYLVISDATAPFREALFIDAHDGEVLDRWSLWMTARNRAVYNGNGGSSLPGTLARAEGAAPVASPTDVNRAYDYAGDMYDYFFRAFGRDSIDDAGMTMILTVNSTNPPCPNAGWNGTQMVFCSGTVTDDITAHEIGHGITERTANLVYQNQPGQLNEAYSDIWGELIDLYNGDASVAGTPGGSPAWPAHPTGPGVDAPNNARSACSPASNYPDGVRWLMGEDATAFGGAIRDMWDPTCEDDPDRNNSPLQTCSAADNGGVHSGSGVANHTFAIMVDGKNFNGQNVTGIGPIKAAAVWYRALTTYLTVSSDYKDAYIALNQAASDLIGTTPNDPITGSPSASTFTIFDAQQVNAAMIATEMHTDGACGATVDILDPMPPTICAPRAAIFADDFEGGVNGWTTATVGNPDTAYNWVQRSNLPFGRGGVGWFCNDLPSPCGGEAESAVHQLTSPVINLPAAVSNPTIMFTHYLATEAGYDGGNVKLRINGGTWTLAPASVFTYNAYNTTLTGGTNTNPIGGEAAWSGAGGQWGTSLIDLSGYVSGGDTVQVRFEFGKDYCNGLDGWYLDDFELFICTCTVDAECDDGAFCNGAETCVGGFCQTSGDPCPGAFCNELLDACVPALFEEDFESGNTQGWTLRGSGSTASTGDWLFGDPIGTATGGQQAQPDSPYAGAACAFTAQNDGGSLGGNDVDDGVIYLVSPTIDLSGEPSAQLSYVRWYFNRDVGVDAGDYFIAQASSNNGGAWVDLEKLETNQSANAWTPVFFNLENSIALTSTVRIRFGASDDAPTGNIIEAALDNIVITGTPSGGCTGDAECADGNLCNGVEQCVSGTCMPGTPLVCDDGNVCTDDTCDALAGCEFTPNNAPCDDGNVCNGAEQCSSGTCMPGTPLVCDDGNVCTDDTCDALAGCEFTSNNAPCDDGNVCNGAEQCSSGTCMSGTPLVCDDGVDCTDDSCDALFGCQSTPNDANCADDGLFCTGATFCDPVDGCLNAGDPCAPGEWCDEPADACVLYGDGDLDADGDVDLHDFLLFQGCLDGPIGASCHPANMAGDAAIDLADFAAFVDALSAGGPVTP